MKRQLWNGVDGISVSGLVVANPSWPLQRLDVYKLVCFCFSRLANSQTFLSA